MVRHADAFCLAFPNDPLANADATGRKLSETAAELVGDSCRLACRLRVILLAAAPAHSNAKVG